MRKRLPKVPRWIVSDQWGVDTDYYNWILYRKTKSGSWKAKHFYPTAVQLLESMLAKEQRLAFDGTVKAAVESGLQAAQAACAAFSLQLRDDLWVGLKRPAGHVK